MFPSWLPGFPVVEFRRASMSRFGSSGDHVPMVGDIFLVLRCPASSCGILVTSPRNPAQNAAWSAAGLLAVVQKNRRHHREVPGEKEIKEDSRCETSRPQKETLIRCSTVQPRVFGEHAELAISVSGMNSKSPTENCPETISCPAWKAAFGE